MTKPIPFSVPDISEAEIEAVSEVLRSGWLTTGRQCASLEAELASYLGSRHVISVASCTAALEIAYASLGLPMGARIGVPTWTFASSALAPAKHGARPVLLDIDVNTLNVSADSVRAAASVGLEALVVVHFGGVPVDEEVFAAAEEFGVPVIEDAAHALGAMRGEKPLFGSQSIGACFSFYATKNLTSGEGGALATESDSVAAFAREFRLHGLTGDAWDRYRVGSEPVYDVKVPGIKGNLSDVLAAIARVQLRRFESLQATRRQLTERYRANLAAVEGIECVPRKADTNSADHLMVVLLPEGIDRREMIRTLADKGIGTAIHFQPLHTLSWFEKNTDMGPTMAPNADRVAQRAMSLPLYTSLTIGDVDRVCSVIADTVGTS